MKNALDTFAFPDLAAKGSLSPYTSTLPNLNDLTSQAESSLGLSNPSADSGNSGGLLGLAPGWDLGRVGQSIQNLFGPTPPEALSGNPSPAANTPQASGGFGYLGTLGPRIFYVILGIGILLIALFMLGSHKILQVAEHLPTA